MLGEVLEVFHGYPQRPLRSFVDSTVGAADHSSAPKAEVGRILLEYGEENIWHFLQSRIVRARSDGGLRSNDVLANLARSTSPKSGDNPAPAPSRVAVLYIGLDVDPIAQQKAESQIHATINDDSGTTSDLEVITRLKNFKDIKTVLAEVDEKFLICGVDGILMDLGISSMQVNNAERGFSVLGNGPLDMRMNPKACLTAKDILNSWPGAEVGRILREYEECNWRFLQGKIVKARSDGGLRSTGDLANLVRSASPKSGGRQGWIKTATRVFQALRIAVNDELKTLEDSMYALFRLPLFLRQACCMSSLSTAWTTGL